MDTNERPQETPLMIDKNAQINVLLNTSDSGEMEINLGRVFHGIKAARRVYAWVLVLCVFVGICAPLLLYQFSKPMLTVSAVATLNYDVPILDETSANEEYIYEPVEDLTAPDGLPLDLSQILSSYVLQGALSGMELSAPVTLSMLRSNITIERVLNESSRQAQELAAKMAEDNNQNIYTQAESIQLSYDKKFKVSLSNGFGDPDSRIKYELTSDELCQLLNRILDAYNDYLVLTYADLKLPDDKISLINTENLDILESLELLQDASDNLYEYCDSKPDSVKAYRSWKTGRSLEDWMQTLRTEREVRIDYLYSYVYTNSIVKDRDTMLVNYQYQLRNAQSQMDALNEKIATVADILKSYKNDQIFVSMQESDSFKSTSTTTDYFNKLIISQAEQYTQATEMEIKIANLQSKIDNLTASKEQAALGFLSENEIMEELNHAVENSLLTYTRVKEHMEEAQASPLYTQYMEHTYAQGTTQNFLTANLNNMLIGAFAGALIACMIWFMAALLPEITRESQNKKDKEAAA